VGVLTGFRDKKVVSVFCAFSCAASDSGKGSSVIVFASTSRSHLLSTYPTFEDRVFAMPPLSYNVRRTRLTSDNDENDAT
jgi:hypothetical protein